jgi:flagellar biogenesis protein FliO
MEGLFFPPPLRKAALPLIVAALLLPQTLFGQAMGQATLDPAPVAGPPALPTQVALQTSAAATSTVAAVTATTESKTAPIPATTAPAAPEIRTPVAPLPAVNEKPSLVDTLPADPSKAVAPMPAVTPAATPARVATPAPAATPLRPIEHQEIRHPSETPAQAAASSPPAPKTAPSTLSNVFQVVAALAVVIGLIFLGKAFAKKYVPGAKTAGNAKGVIEILARYPLAKNQSLVLVRIGSQIVTLNQGKDQSHSVLVINDPNEVAKILGQIEGTSPKSIQAGFNRLLSNARMDLSDPANDPSNELANEIAQDDFESRSMQPENLDTQLEEMAAAKRQLMELRQQVRSVRDSLPR